MTTYAQALVANADRKRKKEVRDFLFSFYTDMQLNKIVGLAGPHIQDYINFCKSKGYTEFEIYEKDGLTAMHQLIQLKDTFARRVPLTETIGTFFTVRDEHVIKTYVYDNPINHTMYHTNKGKYIYAPYKDTSPMCCFAKIA